jgi:hypothetical protein
MKYSVSFGLVCAVLVACKNDPAPQRTPRRPSPRAVAVVDAATDRVVPAAREPPVTHVTTQEVGGDAAAIGAPTQAPSGPRVYRVGESQCVRDPARNNLGVGVHGVRERDRIELELRNVRYACTPAPEYTVAIEGSVLVLRVVAAARAAITRCACRHDQFLQMPNPPNGELTVRVEELATAEATMGTVLATGRIDAPSAGGAGTTSGTAAAP